MAQDTKLTEGHPPKMGMIGPRQGAAAPLAYQHSKGGSQGLVQIQRTWRSVWWYYEWILEYSMHIHSPLHYKRSPPPPPHTTLKEKELHH
jgi:hypothetical protein